ncbi:MAG: lipase, partial [Chloroflexi bacterium]|nr:lipase [Chloroflexota bacterium]
LFGHSFGGATAAQACRLDNRCKAALDLDGYPFGDVVQVGLQQPLMFIWSETVDKQDLFYQQATRDSQAILANGKNGGYQLTIKGARHFNFTDLAVLYAPVIKAMGLLGPIDGARGLKIARDYSIAFFDQTLKQIDAPLLKGPSPDYPEVQFTAP